MRLPRRTAIPPDIRDPDIIERVRQGHVQVQRQGIPEVLAEIEYNIRLLPPCTAAYDAVVTGSNRRVQIRTNQGDAAYLREEPDLLLALKLLPDGNVETVYNGPGKPVWELAQQVKPDRAGYRAVRHSKLRALAAQKAQIAKRVLAANIACTALSSSPPPREHGLSSEF